MGEPLDVVFLPSEDHEHDLLRAAGLARATTTAIERLWIVGAGAGAVDGIARVLAARGVVPSVIAEGGTAGLNRALLLCERDVLIVPAAVVPEPGCVDALVHAAAAYDRIGAVSPTAHTDAQPL